MEHNSHLFELNKNIFDRAFDNLNNFISSKNDIILNVKEFLKGFIDYISENQELISDSQNIFIKYCKYNSKYISVLNKSKKN